MQYGVIYSDFIHHEGDERSRTHPGHGYPAYTEEVKTFKEFKTEDELKLWIERNRNKNFKAIGYEELKIDYKVEVSLKK